MSADKQIGTDEWTTKFMDATREAVSDAIEEHHRAGRCVYITDGDGDICELSPDKKVRKLSKEEIQCLLTPE